MWSDTKEKGSTVGTSHMSLPKLMEPCIGMRSKYSYSCFQFICNCPTEEHGRGGTWCHGKLEDAVGKEDRCPPEANTCGKVVGPKFCAPHTRGLGADAPEPVKEIPFGRWVPEGAFGSNPVSGTTDAVSRRLPVCPFVIGSTNVVAATVGGASGVDMSKRSTVAARRTVPPALPLGGFTFLTWGEEPDPMSLMGDCASRTGVCTSGGRLGSGCAGEDTGEPRRSLTIGGSIDGAGAGEAPEAATCSWAAATRLITRSPISLH
mmetsp:Transcript_18569/g.49879  ORF Transcript_18569/g.49879 Transcript_18569/m.49879 type:complete len:262 (+) Transcript_18569:114-899(+)